MSWQMDHRGQGDVCVHCYWDVIGSWLFQYTKQEDFFFFEGKNTVFILIFLTLFKNLFEIRDWLQTYKARC